MRGFGSRRALVIAVSALALAAFAGAASADNDKDTGAALHGAPAAPDSSTAAPDTGAEAAPDSSAVAPEVAPDSSAAAAVPAVPAFSVTIPTVTAVGSSVDEATLKKVLSGALADNAEAIATLTADSITIPEIDIGMMAPTPDGKGGEAVVHDIEFDHVTGGVAQSVSIGGVESHSDAGGAARFGRISAEQVDIGGLLAFYGLVKGDPAAPLKPIYVNLAGEGGTLTGPGTHCTVGGFSVAGVKARPLKTSFADVGRLVEEMRTGALPTQDGVRQLVDFYADLLSAISSSPLKLGGFDCSATAEDGAPVAFSVGGMTFGSFGGLRYPDFILNDVHVDAGDKGTFGLGQFALKGFDLAPVFAAARALGDKGGAPPSVDDYRALVPPFAGFTLSDLDIDVPDEQDPGQRIKARLKDFDLDLGNYVNGMPTDVASRMQHLAVTLPAASNDSSIEALLAVGIKSLDLGYDIAARWDEASKEIRIWRFSLDGDKLGSIDASSIIGQAGDDLFSSDAMRQIAAALGLTVKQASVHIRDDGLGDLLAAAQATGSGKSVAEVRRSTAALVQATLLFFLGGAANGADVSAAVGKFLGGGQSLSITAIANDAAGVSVAAMQALKDDPAAIGAAITLDAEAR